MRTGCDRLTGHRQRCRCRLASRHCELLADNAAFGGVEYKRMVGSGLRRRDISCCCSVDFQQGACKDGGRGPSIWDAFSHSKGNIIDGSNGDVAVDQYHRYKEDVELIAKLGFEAHRFSISWSRIFPDGLGTKINEEGITYYNNFINALLEKEYFSVYADTCFASFGDRVKDWITFNEPYQTAINGYGVGRFAPGRHECSSTEPFWVAHHQLLAHAAAVSIYRSKYKVVDCEWAEANSDTIEDKVAAARRLDFQLGWYLDPIYHGEYPKVMRERLGDRLPIFSEKDKELLKNSVDFIGLNHYTSRFIAHGRDNHDKGDFYKAQGIKKIVEWEGGEAIGEKAASEWLYVVPWGMHKVLNYIAQRYNNPPIYVTENGTNTVTFFLDRDGADVRGYFAWSLLDNFEWAQGYTKHFGLVYVDYKNGLSRHPISSAYWFLRFFKGVEGKYGREA
ncbi:unnamed protein product [Malus baccata var. baccata]